MQRDQITAGGTASACICNQPKEVKAEFAELCGQQRIHILINNAGSHIEPLRCEEEDFDRCAREHRGFYNCMHRGGHMKNLVAEVSYGVDCRITGCGSFASR
jgi:hypothetical protein